MIVSVEQVFLVVHYLEAAVISQCQYPSCTLVDDCVMYDIRIYYCFYCLFVAVDEIYHLASPASPPNYMYNPIKTIKTNTLGTINMLGLAKRVKARFLLASTSEVYGGKVFIEADVLLE